jgi:hypothetical protein
MSQSSGMMAHHRLRAPGGDGQAFIAPPLHEAGELAAANALRRREQDLDLEGRSLPQLADMARRHLVQAARDYSSAYRDVSPIDNDSILLTGHQPELYHPGVWFKNIALDHLARRLGAVAVNLVIDNDLPRSMAIRCPAMRDGQFAIERLALDASGLYLPFEERAIRDRATFASFGSRLQQQLQPLIPHPMVREFWPSACERAGATGNLGLAIAQARHAWEHRWGLDTCELPLSAVCDTEPFQWFASHLIQRLPEFLTIYNDTLQAYRRMHRLRSRTHPAADLVIEQDWLEAPFWIWSEHDPRRRRLFARLKGNCAELSDRRNLRMCLPLRGNGLDPALQAWQAARQSGIKIRPRALITTMYARLFLSDLFLHGIGGAKYDLLTDEIVRRFLGIKAPAFMTLSATILLPLRHDDVRADDLRRLEQQLRELEFHPEKHAPPSELAEQLAADKRHWIDAAVTPAQRKLRHQKLAAIGRRFQPLVEPLRKRLLVERDELVLRLQNARLLAARDFAFCLYPEETLRHNLLDVLKKHS